MNVKEYRKPEYDIDDLFIERWSPRAMSGEEISEPELFSLFEAARWAPSSFNAQPWRFLYARKNTKNWELFYNLMGDFNQSWTKNAAALIVVVSRKNFEHNQKFSRTHSYDTGAAWMSFALQGNLNGLVVHGMAGFDYDKAKNDLKIPDDFEVQAMIAVGKPGKKEELPEKIQKMEKPNSRKDVSEFVMEGTFNEQ